MYQELHKWEESIQVAETKQHPEVATLKANYFQWLAETGQEEKAAESKEREGDLVTAIHLYLKGGLPARAAAVVTRYEGRTSFQPALLETVLTEAAALIDDVDLHLTHLALRVTISVIGAADATGAPIAGVAKSVVLPKALTLAASPLLQGRFDIKMFKFIGEDLNDVWLHCTGRYFITSIF